MAESNDELITVKTLSKMLVTSVRSIWRYRSSGRLPKPVFVGSSVRWKMSDIQLWIEWDLPSQMEFEALKAERGHDASSK